MPRKRSREEKLFGAACLKLTLEGALERGAAAIEIYEETLSELELTDAEVDGYLAAHRESVVRALEARRGPSRGR